MLVFVLLFLPLRTFIQSIALLKTVDYICGKKWERNHCSYDSYVEQTNGRPFLSNYQQTRLAFFMILDSFVLVATNKERMISCVDEIAITI